MDLHECTYLYWLLRIIAQWHIMLHQFIIRSNNNFGHLLFSCLFLFIDDSSPFLFRFCARISHSHRSSKTRMKKKLKMRRTVESADDELRYLECWYTRVKRTGTNTHAHAHRATGHTHRTSRLINLGLITDFIWSYPLTGVPLRSPRRAAKLYYIYVEKLN